MKDPVCGGCGHRHDPHSNCTQASQWAPGGIPASEIPACACTGHTHAPDCKRRRAIVALETYRRSAR